MKQSLKSIAILSMIFTVVAGAGISFADDENNSSKNQDIIEIVDHIEDFEAANSGIKPVDMIKAIKASDIGPPSSVYRLVYRLGRKQGGKLN